MASLGASWLTALGAGWMLPRMAAKGPSPDQVQAALAASRWAAAGPTRWARRAAVAAVLRWPGPEVLFIRRAKRPGDPWSGDIAFPGGRMQPGDGDTLRTAVREAHEEVGLDLDRAGRPLGTLRPLLAPAHNRPVPMLITPHVFGTRAPTPELALSHEVAEAMWVPLAHFLEPQNRTRRVKRLLGLPLSFRAYDVDGHVLWGLTLQMLERLRRRLRA